MPHVPLTQLLGRRFRRCALPIGLAPEGTEPRLLGTGTLVLLRNQLSIMTAEHVLDQANSEPVLAFRGDGLPAVNLTGTYCHCPELDVALIPVTANEFANHFPEDEQWDAPGDPRWEPVLPAALGASSKCLGDEDLFLQGYPGCDSRYTAFGPGLLSGALSFQTKAKEVEETAINDDLFFAIHYPAEAHDEKGNASPMPDPRGLSGSLVWNTKRQALGADWSETAPEVVGLALSGGANTGSTSSP